MKTVPNGMEIMKTMYLYIADAYIDLPVKEKGIIQFCLSDNNEELKCYLNADGNEIIFSEGSCNSYNVKLEAKLSDWVALAGKQLNPVLGTITRRLKFNGDVSYFKKLIPADLYKVNLAPFSDSVSQFEVSPRKRWKRPAKVLLIDSSPCGTKGYTKLYCDHIERFIKEMNIEIKHLVLSKYKIQPCLRCLQCWLKNEGECILKDDVKELYDFYEESDLIIYAFPVYAYTVPGILKNFIDRGVMRQYPYFEKGIREIRHPAE